MMPDAFARDRSFWERLAWGILVSFLAAIGTLIFVILMNLGLDFVWSWLDPNEIAAFSGTWQIAAILTAAGLVVGLLHHFIKAEETNVFKAVVDGSLEPKNIPASLLVSLVSLIGGFSLGPEVPAGMLAGGLGTWLSDKRKLSDEVRESNVLSGVVSAYGGMFTSPFAFVVMRLELAHLQRPAFFAIITIAAAAATIGFIVFYAFSGQEFAELLRILDLPDYSLELWHLLAGAVFAVTGAALGLIYGITLGGLRRLVRPLANQPIIRCTAGGFLLGLLGMALPLTLFMGAESLEIVTEKGAELGVALIVALVFGKLLATAGAISLGFIGGPIFPLLFVGGAAGTAVNLVFPEIPLALSIGCLMAALTAALLPAPFMIIIVVLLVTGLPATESVPVIMAGILAHAITYGLGYLPRPPDENPYSTKRDAASPAAVSDAADLEAPSD